MNSINLTKKQFDQLIGICKKSRVELSGTIETKSLNGKTYLSGISLDESTIKKQTRNFIEYDYEKMIMDITTRLLNSTEDFFISFHTHPGLLTSCELSSEDKKFTIARQRYLDKLLSDLKNENIEGYKNRARILYVECVIDRNSIAFWFYNDKTNSFDLIKVYVDNVEYKPAILSHKSVSRVIMDSFKDGVNSVRK